MPPGGAGMYNLAITYNMVVRSIAVCVIEVNGQSICRARVRIITFGYPQIGEGQCSTTVDLAEGT